LNPVSCHGIDERLGFDLFGALSFFFRGFTKFTRAEYLKYKSEGRIAPDGVNAKVKMLFQLFIYLCCCLISYASHEELILNNGFCSDSIRMYRILPFALWAFL